MRAFRCAIILVLLLAVPTTGYSQLLPRRRAATGNAIIEQIAIEAVRRMHFDFKDMFKDMFKNLELSFSIQLFAELQMDPEMKKRIESNTDATSPEAMARELLAKGSARVFVKETTRFSKALTKEKFAPPVLEKIFVEYQYTGDHPFKEGIGRDGEFSSRTITPSGYFSGTGGSAKDLGVRRTITCYESNKAKDPNDPIPLTLHCALVFSTQREGKEIEKILWLDLYLEELKMDRVTKALPWKVTNVQHN
jgi:hypothetical protein